MECNYGASCEATLHLLDCRFSWNFVYLGTLLTRDCLHPDGEAQFHRMNSNLPVVGESEPRSAIEFGDQGPSGLMADCPDMPLTL